MPLMKSRNSWKIQRVVFYALFIRELKTRFGGYRLGVFWAIFEPVTHILVLTLLFTIIRDRQGWFGIPFPLFFATGVLSFFLFQKIVLRSMTSITASMGLFAYKQVKPFDAVIVRGFLEGFVILLTMIILSWVGAWFFNFETMPHNPLYVLLIIVLLIMMGLGIGFITAVIGVKYPEASQLVGLILRPLYFIPGVIFPIPAMPEEFRSYLLWNPLLHGVEQFRVGWFQDYPAVDTSFNYIFLSALLFFFFGLTYYHANRTRVLIS